MKLIFCDVDGVLNRFPPKGGDHKSWPPKTTTEVVTAESLGWLPEPVSIIRYFVNINECSIVISSTWRHYMSLKQFEDGLGIPAGSVIGKTKSFMSGRGEEIEQWLEEFNHQDPFVIIDDDVFDIECCESLKGHIVQTETSVGLTTDHIPQIVEALSKW